MGKTSVLRTLGKSILYKNIALYLYTPQNTNFRFGLVWFGLWCLMPLSRVFRLYRGSKFY